MPHSVIRMLPIKGEVMVNVGDTVNADKIVAATYMPGDVYPLNMANLLAVPPKEVMGLMIHKEGKKVEEGEQTLASTELKLGEDLANKYLYPHVKKNDSSAKKQND